MTDVSGPDGGRPKRGKGRPTPFGRLVRSHRNLRSMSQARLAELAGISEGYVSLIESGARGSHVPRETVVALAQAVEADPVEFLRAAGRLEAGDEGPAGPSFETVVQADIRLRADQKRALIAQYRTYVRS